MRSELRATVALSAFLLVSARSPLAKACGAAYPGGPMVCTMADAPGQQREAAKPPPFAHLSVSWSYTSTTILFGQGRRADLTRHAVFAGTELSLARGLGLRFGAGGIVGGELAPHGAHGTATFGPGVTGFVGIAKTLVEEKAVVPFLQVGATLSASRVATRGPRPRETPNFTAFDLRASATVGKTVARVVVPYVALRAFGGPVFYEYAGANVTGTDLYKYQVAGGVSLSLPSRVLDVFVEGVAFGEKGASAGLGTTF